MTLCYESRKLVDAQNSVHCDSELCHCGLVSKESISKGMLNITFTHLSPLERLAHESFVAGVLNDGYKHFSFKQLNCYSELSKHETLKH